MILIPSSQMKNRGSEKIINFPKVMQSSEAADGCELHTRRTEDHILWHSSQSKTRTWYVQP